LITFFILVIVASTALLVNFLSESFGRLFGNSESKPAFKIEGVNALRLTMPD